MTAFYLPILIQVIICFPLKIHKRIKLGSLFKLRLRKGIDIGNTYN